MTLTVNSPVERLLDLLREAVAHPAIGPAKVLRATTTAINEHMMANMDGSFTIQLDDVKSNPYRSDFKEWLTESSRLSTEEFLRRQKHELLLGPDRPWENLVPKP